MVQALLLDLFALFLGLGLGCCCFQPLRRPLKWWLLDVPASEYELARQARRRACVFFIMLLFWIASFIGILWSFLTPPLFSVLVKEAPAHAKNDPHRSVYFGQGCFWHTQYDTTVIEQSVTGPFKGRDDSKVTSLVGYAGGLYQSPGGTACYHGVPGLDYGRLGHAEAVSVELDNITGQTAQAQLVALAEFYFEHGFNTVSGGRRERLDPQDEGAAYRNVIGIPGEKANAELWPLIEAANTHGMPLLDGGGGPSEDREGEYVVYVYDSLEYPFFRAETYHQFHTNDVIGRPVPDSYTRSLKSVQQGMGRLGGEGCVDPPFEELALIIIASIALPCGFTLAALLLLLPERLKIWNRLGCCSSEEEEEREQTLGRRTAGGARWQQQRLQEQPQTPSRNSKNRSSGRPPAVWTSSQTRASSSIAREESSSRRGGSAAENLQV